MYKNILALILIAVCLAERLKQTREAQGLTLRELADMSGVDHVTIWKVEAGAQKGRRSDLLVKVARALKVGTDFVLGTFETGSRGINRHSGSCAV